MTSCLSWRRRGGRLLGAAGLALLLAACGGSGDTAVHAGATVITEVPASATVSAEAYSGFASALLATIPVVILFMFIEKHLVAGLTSGGVKG